MIIDLFQRSPLAVEPTNPGGRECHQLQDVGQSHHNEFDAFLFHSSLTQPLLVFFNGHLKGMSQN